MISVVIPCYNQARWLDDAIRSTLGQTRAPDEVVVVDDGSTDATAHVAARHAAVHYVRQDNAGLAAARNTGLRECKGDVVVFLDADDRLLPRALESGLRALARHPDAALAHGDYRYIRADGGVLGPSDRSDGGDDAYLALLRGNCIGMHATVVYRRRVFDQVGGFDTTLRVAEDYDLYLRIARDFPLASHPTLVAEYRRHASNMSGDLARMLATVLAVLERQRPWVAADPARLEAYREGRRNWRAHYGRLLALQARRELGARRWRAAATSARALGTLAPSAALTLAARRLSAPAHRRLRLGQLRRCAPVSRDFGFDRGLPIDRYYIERFLARHACDVRGRVLEIGDATYTRRFGGARVVQADVLHVDDTAPEATFVGDLARGAALPSEGFDCVILTQTLHLLADPRAALLTVRRILRPGGVALVTVPGVSQIAADQWGADWRWGFTARSAGRLFEDVFAADAVDLDVAGNTLAAAAFLQGIATHELTEAELERAEPPCAMLLLVRVQRRASGCQGATP